MFVLVLPWPVFFTQSHICISILTKSWFPIPTVDLLSLVTPWIDKQGRSRARKATCQDDLDETRAYKTESPWRPRSYSRFAQTNHTIVNLVRIHVIPKISKAGQSSNLSGIQSSSITWIQPLRIEIE